jgi:hypothetical protein
MLANSPNALNLINGPGFPDRRLSCAIVLKLEDMRILPGQLFPLKVEGFKQGFIGARRRNLAFGDDVNKPKDTADRPAMALADQHSVERTIRRCQALRMFVL